MQDNMQWADSERPSDDPDYQRMIGVTQTVEAEIAKIGPRGALNQRFDYDVALRYGMRRTNETSQKVKLENPGYKTLFRLLGAAWPEGFIFGALSYTDERRGRQPEPLLDRIALGNVNQKLLSASEAERSAIFSHTASTRSLGYVGGIRSMQAAQILQQQAPVADHAAIQAIVASHWLDGFFAGLVFEELGGHREE
jgi:hypothetical protein